MAHAAIAGPRRAKQAPPPAPVATAAPRQLPPLDYDEPTGFDPRRAGSARPSPAPAQVPTLPGRRAKVHRLRWFVLGIAFGAVGAISARGQAAQTLHDVRVWSAKALRSLERTAPPPAGAQPSTAAPPARPAEVAMAAPCPMSPGPGDPCADLLAPFAEAPKPPVPTVSIDALPRVKPPVVAKRHRHVTVARPPARALSTTAAAAAAEPSDDDDDVDDVDDDSTTTAQNDPPPIR